MELIMNQVAVVMELEVHLQLVVEFLLLELVVITTQVQELEVTERL